MNTSDSQLMTISGMFTAQFWGRGDVSNLRRVLGLCLILAISASLIFFSLAQLFPEQILSIYSNDPLVIELGSSYISIYSWTFLFFAVTFSYALVMRPRCPCRSASGIIASSC